MEALRCAPKSVVKRVIEWIGVYFKYGRRPIPAEHPGEGKTDVRTRSYELRHT